MSLRILVDSTTIWGNRAQVAVSLGPYGSSAKMYKSIDVKEPRIYTRKTQQVIIRKEAARACGF